MASGRVSINTRPIRFAFLVDIADESQVERSIRLATMLWGGGFAPIIPEVAPQPRTTEQDLTYRLAYDNYVERFLERYDPDVIVTLDSSKISKLGDVGGREVVAEQQIFDGTAEGWTMAGFGIGLCEITRQILVDELTYVRRVPFRFVLPHASEKASSVFLSAVFGDLPDGARDVFLNLFNEDIKPTDVSVTTLNFATYLPAHYMYPERLSRSYIDIRYPPRERGAIFFLAPSDLQDVVEFWSVRARGCSLFPFPIEHLSSTDLLDAASLFGSENIEIWAGNRSVNVYYSSSVRVEDLNAILEALGKKNNCAMVVRRMPEWLSDPRPERYNLSVGSKNVDIGDSQTHVEFRVSTRFMRGVSLQKVGPSLANQIDFRFYGNYGKLAEVVPPGDPTILRAFDAWDETNWRLSPRGLIHYQRFPEEEEHVKLPESEDVIRKWFQRQGYEVVESGAGKVARQISRQFSNGRAIGVLADEQVIRILERLEKGECTKDEIRARLGQLKLQLATGELQNILNKLVRHRAVQFGLSVKCPVCGRSRWYRVDQLHYTIECAWCFAEFSFAAQGGKETKWAYKLEGPFTLGERAQGALSVLATYSFFTSGTSRYAVTPTLSIGLTKDGVCHELDFGAFVRDTDVIGIEDTKKIFGECKSFNDFVEVDIKRMKYFLEHFSDGVILFSTLKNTLSQKEAELIKGLASTQTDNNNYPLPRILILTDSELLSDFPPPYCWSTEQRAKVPHYVHRDLMELCDATCRLYLDLDPYFERVMKLRKAAIEAP